MSLCTNCNTKEALEQSRSRKPLLVPGWCHSCMFWKEIADDVASGRKKITEDFKVYHFKEYVPNPSRGQMLGHGGHVWRIIQKDCVLITNNLWYNGEVPEHWRNEPNLQPNCFIEQNVTLQEVEKYIGHYRCPDCGKFIKDGEKCSSTHTPKFQRTTPSLEELESTNNLPF